MPHDPIAVTKMSLETSGRIAEAFGLDPTLINEPPLSDVGCHTLKGNCLIIV